MHRSIKKRAQFFCLIIRTWIASPSGITSLVLIGVIFILFFVNTTQLRNDYTIGLTTEFIGIIVTIVFVQALFDNRNFKEAKRNENDAIKRVDKVMQLYITRYIKFFQSVVTPIANRAKDLPIEMPEEFTLEDMRDLHKPSLLIIDSVAGSSIEIFYEIELILRKYTIDILRTIDFKFNETLEKLLLEFIDISVKFDCRNAILSAKNIIAGTEKLSDVIAKQLEQKGNDFHKSFLGGEQQETSILHPYLILYFMMKEERDIINRYKQYISTL